MISEFVWPLLVQNLNDWCRMDRKPLSSFVDLSFWTAQLCTWSGYEHFVFFAILFKTYNSYNFEVNVRHWLMSFALQGHACTVWDSLGRYWTHWDAKRYFGRKSNFNFLLLTILLIGECCLTIIYVAVMQRIDRKKKGNLDTWFTNLSLPFNVNAQHSSVIKVISFLHCAFLLIILHFILC